MRYSDKVDSELGSASNAALQAAFGAAGLVLVALGAVLPGVSGTWAFSLICLPVGTLLCGGVGLLQCDRPRSPAVYAGMSLVVIGVLAAAVLAVFTAEPFCGLKISGDSRAFRMPIWHELLIFHLLWTCVAVVAGLGVRIIARPQLERDLVLGLAVFAVYPLIGLFAFLLQAAPG